MSKQEILMSVRNPSDLVHWTCDSTGHGPFCGGKDSSPSLFCEAREEVPHAE